MRIQDLEAFLAINQFGSISAAAQNLYITQPTLSNMIKSLETELNTQLIYRHRGVRSTTLTPAGQALVPQAEKLISLISETKSIVGTAAVRTIRFTCVQSALSFVIPAITKKLKSSDYSCSLDLQAMSSEHAYEHIAGKDIDIALCCSPPPQYVKNIYCEYMFDEPLVFISQKNSPYGENVSVHDLKLSDQILVYWSKNYMMWQEHWFGSIEMPYLKLKNNMISEEYFNSSERWAVIPKSASTKFNTDIFKISTLDHNPPNRQFYLVSGYPPIEPYYSMIKESIIDIFKNFSV